MNFVTGLGGRHQQSGKHYTVTLPTDMADKVDAQCKALRLSRNKFLQMLVESYFYELSLDGMSIVS